MHLGLLGIKTLDGSINQPAGPIVTHQNENAVWFLWRLQHNNSTNYKIVQ